MERLRALTRVLVVLGLVLSTQSLLMLQMAFELRRDYIAEHLCVNRDRPEMECNGKCYLRAQSEAAMHGPALEDPHAHHAPDHAGAQEKPHTHPAPVSNRQVNLLEVALSGMMFVPVRPALRMPGVTERPYAAWRPTLHDEAAALEVFHPPRMV
jgi:hypothetical protein